METVNRKVIVIIVAVLITGAISFFVASHRGDTITKAMQSKNGHLTIADQSEDSSETDCDQALLQPKLTDEVLDPTPVIETPQFAYVDIDGAVVNPGVFKVPLDTRLYQVIEMAGGLTEEADTRMVNRAALIRDGQKIVIPNFNPEEEMLMSFFDDEENSQTQNQEESSQQSTKININTASQKELETLPGIGEVLAQRIIDYRQSKSFTTIDQIKEVSGIGDKKFLDIKDKITVK